MRWVAIRQHSTHLRQYPFYMALFFYIDRILIQNGGSKKSRSVFCFAEYVVSTSVCTGARARHIFPRKFQPFQKAGPPIPHLPTPNVSCWAFRHEATQLHNLLNPIGFLWHTSKWLAEVLSVKIPRETFPSGHVRRSFSAETRVAHSCFKLRPYSCHPGYFTSLEMQA